MEQEGLLSGQQYLFQEDLERVKRGEADTHSNGPLDPVHGEALVQPMAHPFLPVPQTEKLASTWREYAHYFPHNIPNSSRVKIKPSLKI